MSILIEGRSYLTLEMISNCYDCDVTWMSEAYELGLLGTGYNWEGRLVFAVTILDRVAEVVRLGRYQGLSFETIVVLLGDDEPELQADEIIG